MLNIIVTLKCGLEFTQYHWYYLKAWVRFPIRLPLSIVTMAVSLAILSHFGDIQRQRMA